MTLDLASLWGHLSLVQGTIPPKRAPCPQIVLLREGQATCKGPLPGENVLPTYSWSTPGPAFQSPHPMLKGASSPGATRRAHLQQFTMGLHPALPPAQPLCLCSWPARRNAQRCCWPEAFPAPALGQPGAQQLRAGTVPTTLTSRH